MISSIIFCFIISIVWCVVITTPMIMIFMPFGGAPGLSKKEKIILSGIPLLIAAIAYIGIPVLIFYTLL